MKVVSRAKLNAQDRGTIPEPAAPPPAATAFGCPRDFLDHRFVYTVVSPRARGLSAGVNLCPNKVCNFNCVYCEVDWAERGREQTLDIPVMAAELKQTLALIQAGQLRQRPGYRGLPDELLRLQHVTLSGDGEPTLVPWFADALEAIVHVRASAGFPFFKLVLVTNATGLDRPQVQRGLRYLTQSDEVWAKLDGGTQTYINQINRTSVSLETVLNNILQVARQRPVIIQSLFAAIKGLGPPPEEIKQYTARLQELQRLGAQIDLVQIYSATRPTTNPGCGHLALRTLSDIAQTVRRATGLPVEIF